MRCYRERSILRWDREPVLILFYILPFISTGINKRHNIERLSSFFFPTPCTFVPCISILRVLRSSGKTFRVDISPTRVHNHKEMANRVCIFAYCIEPKFFRRFSHRLRIHARNATGNKGGFTFPGRPMGLRENSGRTD